MATDAQLRYVISVQDRELRELKKEIAGLNKTVGRDTVRSFGAADKSASKTSRTFGALGTAGRKAGRMIAFGVGAAAVAITGGLVVAAKVGWDEFRQGQKVAAQTNAVLESTGGVANVTAKEIDRLATSIMDKSGMDDEAVKTGENLLLTFTNVRNEVGRGNDIFSQATTVLADMSIALGQDMSSSAIQLGKALNDPIKGITALRRVGVSFTQAQQDEITSLVETGQTLKAQKLILRELNKEFGGSAKAAGETLPGKLAILRERFNNFAGSLVEHAIPTLEKFVGFADKLSKQKSWNLRIHTILAGAGGALETLLFGSPATRIRVPIEGGRFEWQVKGGGTGLVGAVSKAIRDIDWVEVGTEIVVGFKQGLEHGITAAGFDPNKGLLPQVWPNAFGWLGVEIPRGPTGWGLVTRAFGALEDDANAATHELNGFQRDTGSSLTRAGRSVETFQRAASDHFDMVGRDTDKARGHVSDLRSEVERLHSKTIKVSADVSGLSQVAALAEHLALMKSTYNVAVNVKGPSGDGVVSPGGGPSSISPTLYDDLALANSYGLFLTPQGGYRPGAITSTGNPSLHGVYPSKAVDVAGSAAAMNAFFWAEVGRAPFSGIRELIHSPLWWHPGVGVTAIPGTAGSVLADHYSHVHVGSYDQGGWLMPGWNLAYNGLGAPEPVGGGGGTQQFVVNFHGPVYGDKRAIAEVVREELRKFGRRNARPVVA